MFSPFCSFLQLLSFMLPIYPYKGFKHLVRTICSYISIVLSHLRIHHNRLLLDAYNFPPINVRWRQKKIRESTPHFIHVKFSKSIPCVVNKITLTHLQKNTRDSTMCAIPIPPILRHASMQSRQVQL